MADGLPRHGPLAHQGLARRTVADAGDAGVHLALLPPRAAVSLRGEMTGEHRAIVAEQAGCGLPADALTSANMGGVTALWLGPEEWLIAGTADGVATADGAALTAKLQKAFRGQFITTTDLSDALRTIRLAGPNAGDVLSKGCGLDLHPRVFPTGNVARTLLARAEVILHLCAADTCDLYVRRSYADYLWRWFEDAGREFGVAVVGWK